MSLIPLITFLSSDLDHTEYNKFFRFIEMTQLFIDICRVNLDHFQVIRWLYVDSCRVPVDFYSFHPLQYILSSLDDPHTPLSFQADRRLWERVKKSINVYGKRPTVSGTHSQPEHTERALMIKLYRRLVGRKTLQPWKISTFIHRTKTLKSPARFWPPAPLDVAEYVAAMRRKKALWHKA